MVNSNPDNFAEPKMIQLVFTVDQFFKHSRSGATWGTVYFQIGNNECFPERGWTDLVSAFLRIWLEALISIADGSAKKVNAPFLDGPLAVFLSSHDKNLVELCFVHREATKYSAIAATRELLHNALAVAEEFLAVCGQRGWADDDTEALAALTKQGARTLSGLSVKN
jgi:hypothetical protein